LTAKGPFEGITFRRAVVRLISFSASPCAFSAPFAVKIIFFALKDYTSVATLLALARLNGGAES
jgi:hypothetical protein